jgi:hypothetical protein
VDEYKTILVSLSDEENPTMNQITRRLLLGTAISIAFCLLVPDVAQSARSPKWRAPIDIDFGYILRRDLLRGFSRSFRCNNEPNPTAKKLCEERKFIPHLIAGGIVGTIGSVWVLHLALESRRRRRLGQVEAELAEIESQMKPTPPPPPLDPLEAQLHQLSAENWLSANQKWEVFRSGAQGPYTREEMRSIQKITARTNVRQVGEEKWTRAGEIPELADVLS